MRWYWWLWVLLMWWMLFGCGDPADVLRIEEKPSHPKMGSGSQRSGEVGVRSMGAEKSSRGSGERDSDDNRRGDD